MRIGRGACRTGADASEADANADVAIAVSGIAHALMSSQGVSMLGWRSWSAQ